MNDVEAIKALREVQETVVVMNADNWYSAIRVAIAALERVGKLEAALRKCLETLDDAEDTIDGEWPGHWSGADKCHTESDHLLTPPAKLKGLP